jgi:hypothetical protein
MFLALGQYGSIHDWDTTTIVMEGTLRDGNVNRTSCCEYDEREKCNKSEDKGGGGEHLRKRVDSYTRLGRRISELDGSPWAFNICRRGGSKNHGRVYRALRVLFGIGAICVLLHPCVATVEPDALERH